MVTEKELNWKIKYHPNRFLLYRKLVKEWQRVGYDKGFIDVFSFVWLPFLLFWFFIAAPYVAIFKDPIFFIYIPVMIPAYIGLMLQMNRRIDRLQKRIDRQNFVNFMNNRSW